MRWTVKEKPKKVWPELGTSRIITKFLYFPKTLRNSLTKKLERRWLETVQIYQEYKVAGYYLADGGGGEYNDWVNIHFVEEQE